MEKIKYNREEYEKDLKNPNMPHIKNRERFEAFYNELGKDLSQRDQNYEEKGYDFIQPKGDILELGCHWGFNLIHWAKKGHKCVGVEISKSLVDYGLEQISKEPEEVRSKITLINGWIEEFSSTVKYGTILLMDTLEHVIDPKPILRKVVEYLKPEGFVYISSPSTRRGTYSHVRGINKQEMQYLIDEAGLEAFAWNKAFERLGHTVLIARLK